MKWDAVRLATLAAAVDRIIPADEFPSAWDAGVGNYIDRLLDTDLRATAEHFLSGLDSLNAEALAAFFAPFAELSAVDQDAVLERIERGIVAAPVSQSAARFFETIVNLTAEGYYSDPGNGGNRGALSWKMVGYEPGANG